MVGETYHFGMGEGKGYHEISCKLTEKNSKNSKVLILETGKELVVPNYYLFQYRKRRRVFLSDFK